jgi:small subunit ribosomal protein S6
MRDYEVVYIFKSSLTTEEIEGRLESYHGKILGVDGSEITAVEHWGKRQLAYPIDRNDNGYYVVTQFTASPAVLPDFERVLKLDDDLLRHLVVISEGELPIPMVDDRREAGGEETRGGRDEDSEDSDADDEEGDEYGAEEEEAAVEDEGDEPTAEGETADDDEDVEKGD